MSRHFAVTAPAETIPVAVIIALLFKPKVNVTNAALVYPPMKVVPVTSTFVPVEKAAPEVNVVTPLDD